MTTKKIRFTRYNDPFSEIIQGFENDEDTAKYGLVGLEDGEDDDVLPRFKRGPKLPPAIVGDLGVLPINDKTLASKHFNFWMINTNFKITKDVFDAIDNCLGVESFNLYSPYKCRISIGQLFSESDVQETLRMLLCEPPKPKRNIDSKVFESTGKFLSSKYAYWAMVSSNGKAVVPLTGDTQAAVEEKLKQYEGSEVIKSWS